MSLTGSAKISDRTQTPACRKVLLRYLNRLDHTIATLSMMRRSIHINKQHNILFEIFLKKYFSTTIPLLGFPAHLYGRHWLPCRAPARGLGKHRPYGLVSANTALVGRCRQRDALDIGFNEEPYSGNRAIAIPVGHQPHHRLLPMADRIRSISPILF